MEGWHSTGTTLLPLLRRVAPSSGTVNIKVSNLQYPSRWKVHIEAKTYQTQEKILAHQVVDVNPGTRARLLGEGRNKADTTRSLELLHRLHEIDPQTSALFCSRDEVQQQFAMRLLLPNEPGGRATKSSARSNRGPENNEITVASYVALSYCWHYPTWQTSPGLCNPFRPPLSEPKVPTTIPMWKAFLAERQSTREAIWVDQECIRQTNEAEKSSAINSMDVVFGGARKVVIALEDVLLRPQDAEVLLQYGHSIQSLSGRQRLLVWSDWLEFLEHKEELAVACLKIFRARWFRRAWCSHEFLTAKSHTFLVPITNDSQDAVARDSATILSFNADFLLALLLARTEWVLSKDRSELADIIVRHEAHLDHKEIELKVAVDRFMGRHNIMVGFTQGLLEATLRRANSESKKPYLAALGDILSLDSSSAVDKLAITLNVLRTGLSYQGPSDLNETDVSYLANLVALAANDASALASDGSFLKVAKINGVEYNTAGIGSRDPASNMSNVRCTENKAKNAVGWATRPRIDTYSRLGLERMEVPVLASMAPTGLRLAMSFVASSQAVRAPNAKYLRFVESLLGWYPRKACSLGNPLREPSSYEDLVLANFRAFSLEPHQVHQLPSDIDSPQLTQALACLLELGQWWLTGYGRQFGIISSPPTNEPLNKVQALPDALKWAQSAMPTMQPIEQQSAAGGADDVSLAHATVLFRYASEVVRVGAGERSEFVKQQVNPDFSFRICKIHDTACHTSSGIETLFFGPSGSSPSYDLAIPLCLTTPGFPVDMDRVWILEKRMTEGVPESEPEDREYVLRGKTRFVGCTVPDGLVRQVTVGG